MSPSFQTFQVCDAVLFGDLMTIAQAEIEPIGKGAFQASGTGVGTFMVKISMPQMRAGLEASNRSPEEFKIELAKRPSRRTAA